MSSRWSRAVVLASALALVAAGVPSPAAPQEVPPGAIFSARSDLVVLNVAVTDSHGAYVADLTRDAFTVFEDGRPQSVELFSSHDAPVTVGLVVDNSGSMGPSRARVSVAAGSFAATSNPQDEIFALVFNESVRTVLPAGMPFTDSPSVLRNALHDAIAASGRTALFDAVGAGLAYLTQGANARKVLVIVSDGGDNASHSTLESVRRQTEASNTLIYTIGLPDPFDRDARPDQLKRLAIGTGGQAFLPKATSDVDAVLKQVARDIRSMYTIGYAASNPGANGHFRRIRVTAATHDGRELRVRTREGYVVEDR